MIQSLIEKANRWIAEKNINLDKSVKPKTSAKDKDMTL
jgi:hypothetical protein